MGHWNASMQEQLRQHNLNVIKMRAIAVLSIISGLTINELSVYTVAEQSTMSRSLDALEKQSLIRRVSSEEDGRVRRIYITDLGRETFDKIWPIMYENHQNLIQGISQEEHKLLIKVLQKMQLNLENS
jgi:DNA-binding MarR family transcriptional regulator